MMGITNSNIMQADLNLLPVLRVLFQTRSVSRTAEQLNLSQPAVSRMLRRLRDQLGDPLFVRGKSGMVPTEKARELEPILDTLWERLSRLYDPTQFDPQTANRTFTVSASDYFEAVMLPELLRELERHAPGIGIRSVALTQDTWPLLETGEVDLAVALARNFPPHLKHRRLMTDGYVCIAAKGHPDLADGLDLDAYCALSHLQVKVGNRTFHPKSPIDTALDALGRRRNVAVTISTLFNAARVVSTTRLIATMPETVARLEAQTYPIEIYPSPISIPRARVAVGWHPRAHEDPAHRFLRKLMLRSVE